jgi:AraC family transcriptional regulator
MIKIRAAIPVQEQVKGKNEVEYFELPAGKVLFVKHFGGYDTSRSHEAIEEFMQDFNITCDDYIWEVYVTDPATEPDESKWETDIYYPIK